MPQNGKECGYVYRQTLIWNSVTWMISCVISGKKKLGYLHNLNTNQTKTHKQTSFTLVLKHEKEI